MIKVGCDPEFTLIDQNGSKVNFDFKKKCLAGEINNDHGGRVGELNPKPDTNPKVVLSSADH